jgi:hypothetical protein
MKKKHIDVYSIKTIQCQHILILMFINACSTIFLMMFIQHFTILMLFNIFYDPIKY